MTTEAQVELSVVMPCLNEADTIATCVEKAQRALREGGIVGEVIVADNGSVDGSQAIAESLGARVVPVAAKGYGNALMRSRLDRCDAEYAPAYLESSNPDNVPYYERFGFEVTGEIRLPDGPSLVPMWRQPR